MTIEEIENATRLSLEAWNAVAGDPHKMAASLSPECRLAVAWLGQECYRLSQDEAERAGAAT